MAYGNGKYCYPLTIRDEYSRYILDISALPGTGFEGAKERFTGCFERYGLPGVIRSDNGNPFACMKALGGLSRLSVWWLKLGVMPNRIPPRSPHLNGAHERMHLDMANELEVEPQRDLGDEQKRFDDWREEYNTVRPHKTLKQKTPDTRYKKSRRRYQGVTDFRYPKVMEQRKVCGRGMMAWGGRRTFLSNSLRREYVGIQKESQDEISLWFCELLLGVTDSQFTAPLGGQ